MSNPFSLLFSFVYLDQASLPKFNLQPGTADRAYLKLPPGMKQADVQQTIYSSWPYPASSSYRGWSTTTADQTLRSNLIAADVISRFVLLLSLVGLVIGGVGIINTMLVTVNRRSGEIAVLKTLGLKGRGVSLIFLIEAILSGILGSLLGIVLGIGLSFIARDFGEEAFGVMLPWHLYADPMVIGMALGIAVTLFFSFLPTLMAGQIRPAIVLRQGGIPMARAGCLMSLVSLTVLVVGMGLIIDLIIGNTSRYRIPIKLAPPLTIGILTSLIVFLLLGLIIGVMWVLVWLIGRLPSFRNADLRIAIRGLTMHRNRTALSLLALITGMTALSGTLIMTRSINVLLYTSISEPMGGNVIILPLLPVDNLARSQLDGAHGVTGYRDIRFTSSRLVAINGNRNYEQQLGSPDDPHTDFVAAQLELLLGINVHGNPPRGQLIEGRYLGTEDAEQRHIVIPYIQQLAAMGVKVGSTFTYRLGRNGQNVDFEVVGVVAPDARSGLIPFSLSDSAVQAPVDALPKDMPMDFIIADVDPQSVNDVMAAVGNIPGIFVFDIGIFDSMINRILNQMAALPLLIAGLSLFAAAALIATTVSLATMERRRQIGILKAIGVKRRRALKQLLIENGIIGVTGGIISLLPTLLILGAVPALTEGFVTLPVPYDLIALMLILAVVITLGATLLTAWSAASEKPLTVLRYE
jgi:putative ABC transport system permease protein